MRGGGILRSLIVSGLALAVAAPAAGAVDVRWGTGYSETSGILAVTGAPGEANDLRFTAVGDRSTKEFLVEDRSGTLTTAPPVPPGDCDDYGCTVPCRILDAHLAKCAIADGFTAAIPGSEHGFDIAYVTLGDGGPGRVRVLPASRPFSYMVDGSPGGSRYWFSTSYAYVAAAANDTVNFTPGAGAGGTSLLGGGVSIAGPNVTVNAVDGVQENIFCTESGLNPRLRLDPLDWASEACEYDGITIRG